MLLSTPTRTFAAGAVILIMLALFGCGQPAPEDIAAPEPQTTEYPFSVREPEIYQAEIVVSAGGRETRMFVARSGMNRRTDFDLGGPQQTTVLETTAKYLISYRYKIYTADGPTGGGQSSAKPLLPDGRDFAVFENAGSENGLAVYRARPRDGGPSEVMIWFDPAASLPVREEFYSTSDGGRVLQSTVELRGVKLENDAGIFEIPPGFRQTSIEEFRKTTGKR